MDNRMYTRYLEEVVPTLTQEFGYRNPMQVPTISKITLNIGVGEAIDEPRSLDGAVEDLKAITGQQPVVTRREEEYRHLQVARRSRDWYEGHPAQRADVGAL